MREKQHPALAATSKPGDTAHQLRKPDTTPNSHENNNSCDDSPLPMDDPEWYEDFILLVNRYGDEYGITPYLPHLTMRERYGVYCNLFRLGSTR